MADREHIAQGALAERLNNHTECRQELELAFPSTDASALASPCRWLPASDIESWQTGRLSTKRSPRC